MIDAETVFNAVVGTFEGPNGFHARHCGESSGKRFIRVYPFMLGNHKAKYVRDNQHNGLAKRSDLIIRLTEEVVRIKETRFYSKTENPIYAVVEFTTCEWLTTPSDFTIMELSCLL